MGSSSCGLHLRAPPGCTHAGKVGTNKGSGRPLLDCPSSLMLLGLNSVAGNAGFLKGTGGGHSMELIGRMGG